MQIDPQSYVQAPVQATGPSVALKPLRASPPPDAAANGTEGKAAPTQIAATEKGPFGEDGFTFFDFLDIVNPLQHLPVVSTLYRQLTGDSIDPGARMAGNTLFGGPLGLASWVVNNLSEAATGKDIGENVMAWFGDGANDKTAPEPAVQVAQATPAPEDTVAASLAAFETAGGGAATAPQDIPPPVGEAELFASAQRESARRAAVFARTSEAGPAPSGSAATEGGWFTNAMLSALESYKSAANLPTAGTPRHAVNEAH